MRKSDPAVALDPALAAAADSGVKAMIPIGRPFLDYVLGVAADAGITRACLVVGPEHGQMQKYYTELAAAADDQSSSPCRSSRWAPPTRSPPPSRSSASGPSS